MKVQTTVAQLRSALSAFSGVIDRPQTVPVLGTVRFEDGRLVGTDLDTEVSVALPSIGKMDGSACIDWMPLYSLSRSADASETLTVSETDGTASAAFNGSEYQMASVPVSQFPDFSAANGVESMTGNLGLVAAMNRVRFSISTEETRYYLNGVAIMKGGNDDRVVAVATNGHQLAMVPLEGAPDGSIGAIIPSRLVRYFCARKSEPVSCVFDAERLRATFAFAGLTVRAKLIDGTYPDIWRVIPKDTVHLFSAERLSMLRVLNRLRGFVRSRGAAVRVSLEGPNLKLAVSNLELRATERLSVEHGAAEPFDTGFNLDYLIAALVALRSERLNFASDVHFGSGPAVITGEGDPLFQLLMPMRV